MAIVSREHLCELRIKSTITFFSIHIQCKSILNEYDVKNNLNRRKKTGQTQTGFVENSKNHII